MDFDELNEDNDNPDIYYDEKYDETRYDILDEFKEKASNMKKDEFKEFLISHLIQNVIDRNNGKYRSRGNDK